MLNRMMKHSEEVAYLVVLLTQIRKEHPTLNCVAMYYKINPVSIGRDKFLAMCREHGFIIENRPRSKRTTDSNGVIRFPNLMINLELTGINQAFSSDITYFEIKDCFYFITFVMDCYSRRILGYNVSSRLFTEHTTLPALQMAIKTRNNKLPPGIIFHSDGGGQYYDGGFLKLTERYKFRNSMCEYAYENGKVERLNGIIKNNYLRHLQIETMQDLVIGVDQSVRKYNEYRPHKALGYMSPKEFEKKCISLLKQTMPMMTGSFDAKAQDLRGIEPQNPEQTQPLNHGIFDTKNSS
jgi:putative transposase